MSTVVGTYGGVLEPDGEIGADVLPFTYRWSSAPQAPRIVVPTPVCRVENFLGTARADALLSYAVSRQGP
ncbi:hypothetical protein GCM10018779_51100 [Streptomyces griseocarneus]|nr:hypothetical protein GCM10018779_51100 [Streptomyces griseocarneus]